jgi:hypothetical protein
LLVEQAMPVGDSVWLRQKEEGLFVRLKAHPTVRLVAAEIRAARALEASAPERVEFAAYVVRLEAAWPGIVQSLVEAERGRVRRALEALTGLEAQLQ